MKLENVEQVSRVIHYTLETDVGFVESYKVGKSVLCRSALIPSVLIKEKSEADALSEFINNNTKTKTRVRKVVTGLVEE